MSAYQETSADPPAATLGPSDAPGMLLTASLLLGISDGFFRTRAEVLQAALPEDCFCAIRRLSSALAREADGRAAGLGEAKSASGDDFVIVEDFERKPRVRHASSRGRPARLDEDHRALEQTVRWLTSEWLRDAGLAAEPRVAEVLAAQLAADAM